MSVPTVSSSNTQAFTASTTTAVLTKPTGLAVGDLMIATVAQYSSASSGGGWTLPSGWTAVSNYAGTVAYTYLVAKKVADSGDTAASNFTFTYSKSGITGGIIARVTNVASGVEIETSEADSSTITAGTTISFTGSSTPRADNSLLLSSFIYQSFSIGSVPTISSYTSTPTGTWTEVADIGSRDGSSDGGAMSLAYLSTTDPTQVTAYGSTVSLSADWNVRGVLIIVNGIVDATGTNTLLSVSPTQFSQSGTSGTTGTNTLLAVSPTLNSQSGMGTLPSVWTSTPKS